MFKATVVLVVSACIVCGALPVLGGEIHRAIEADSLAWVKQILAADPGAVHQRDDDRFRSLPIHYVANTGNVEILELLLEAGAEIDAGDSDNSTALGAAAMSGNDEIVALLIERGADVNIRDRKADCPLSFATYGRDSTVVQLLLDAGADLYFRNPNGETLLHVASQRGVRMLVEHLLDNDADIDARAAGGATPVGYAAMSGHPEIVALLLERGADPNGAQTEDAATPLEYTTWRNQVECARTLIEKGAMVDRLGHRNNTPLVWAADRSSLEMVELLLSHGANVNHMNEAGETALVKAAAAGHADRVAALLAAKADPNLGSDEGGRSALQLAAIGGYVDVARRLVENGTDINKSTAGDTPLHLARYYGHDELARLLAEKGAKSHGPEKIDRSLTGLGDVAAGEAAVWFLGHSGWAVKTQNHVLVFDYFLQGEDPASAALCNGRVNPSELTGNKVAVFATHSHGDHFDPVIFGWREQVDDITYFLGLEPQEAPPYELMTERMEKRFGDLEVTAIHSTDAGVGVVIEVDGVTIFHPGDHANGRIGLMEEFTDEIDFLAEKKIRPDICFMGIRGCSLGAPEEVKEGIEYTLKTLQPRVFIPMHAQAQGHLYREFIDDIRDDFTSIQMVAPGNRGDHFLYRGGKIEDPRDESLRQASAE